MRTKNGVVAWLGFCEALYGLWSDRREQCQSRDGTEIMGGDRLVSLYSALSCWAMGTGSHVPASLMVSGGPEMSKCLLTQFVSSFSAAVLAVGKAAFHIVVSEIEPVS